MFIQYLLLPLYKLIIQRYVTHFLHLFFLK